jgi:ArsR family transcriptional regulator
MTNQIGQVEALLKGLADSTRLRILSLLATGEVCVCHIHESLKIPQPKASRHLAYLRRAGLVNSRREGLWVYYRLASPADPVIATIQQAVTHAVGHVDALRKDTLRLQRQTGCEPRADASVPGCACCEPGTRSHALAR